MLLTPDTVFSCLSPVALTEPQICYLLDGVLFLYGIVLTALYCGVKVCTLHICPYGRICGQKKLFVSNPRNLYFLFFEVLLYLFEKRDVSKRKPTAHKKGTKILYCNTHIRSLFRAVIFRCSFNLTPLIKIGVYTVC